MIIGTSYILCHSWLLVLSCDEHHFSHITYLGSMYYDPGNSTARPTGYACSVWFSWRKGCFFRHFMNVTVYGFPAKGPHFPFNLPEINNNRVDLLPTWNQQWGWFTAYMKSTMGLIYCLHEINNGVDLLPHEINNGVDLLPTWNQQLGWFTAYMKLIMGLIYCLHEINNGVDLLPTWNQ